MPEHSVFAIILAAGQSIRFGSTKQLFEFEGESLVGRAARLAEELCGDLSVLVVGSDWKRVLAACGPRRGFFVLNDRYESGMASSIACGVSAVAQVADAVLLILVDQPLMTVEHLESLLDAWERAPNSVVVSEYSGIQGPPAVFPSGCFDALMRLEGDQGARALLSEPAHSVQGIVFEAAAVDIDTPDDLAKLRVD